jgi:hypothetical protein
VNILRKIITATALCFFVLGTSAKECPDWALNKRLQLVAVPLGKDATFFGFRINF